MLKWVMNLRSGTILLFCLIPASTFGFQNHGVNKGFVINGTVHHDSIIDKKIILITQSDEIKDTLSITGDNFSFTGFLKEATYATLIINNKTFRFPLINDKVKIVITSIEKKRFVAKLSNSRIKENLDEYFKVDSENYADKYKALMSQGLNATDEGKMLIEAAMDSLITGFIDQCISKYKGLKDKDGYAIIIQDLTGFFGTRNYPKKIDEFFRLLPAEQRSGFYGKKIQTYLDQAYKIAPGQTIDFQFSDINGKQQSVKEFEGKFVLLEFWATWCGPCIELMPELKRIYQSGKMEIISVSIDEDIDKWKAKTPKLGMDWINIHSKQQENLKDKFFVNGVPHNVLLSQEGKVLKTNVTLTELERLIN